MCQRTTGVERSHFLDACHVFFFKDTSYFLGGIYSVYIYIYYIVVVISHGKFLTLVHNILEIVVMLEDPRDEYLLVYGGVVMFSSLILHAQKRM